MIRATEYPSSVGEAKVVPSGDGILPANSTSLTLKFVQDEGPVSVESIDQMEVPMTRLFMVADGAVGLQLGQFELVAVLAPPPSNPALPVSHIPVRISVVGTDVVLTRTSDAAGRFAIEALPGPTVLFEAHTVASGVNYYADAPLTLCADRSVTLVMRNVKDLVAGVPGLRPHPGRRARTSRGGELPRTATASRRTRPRVSLAARRPWSYDSPPCRHVTFPFMAAGFVAVSLVQR